MPTYAPSSWISPLKKIITLPPGASMCCCGPPPEPPEGPCSATGATWNGHDFTLIDAADAPTCGPTNDGFFYGLDIYPEFAGVAKVLFLDVAGDPAANNFQRVYIWSENGILHVTSCSETGDGTGVFSLDDSTTSCDQLNWIDDEAELSYSIGSGGTIRLTR
ncbi:MAG: hypothetical protein KJ000_25025 [Pirellulaceae bacterium]|nr:hypothetical protein [Pirellulaceae bacterium]